MKTTPFQRIALGITIPALALTLGACSAGQITQTSDQVAAVDGSATSQNDINLRDVTVVIGEDGSHSLKFAVSYDPNTDETITLNKVTVDGKDVTLTPKDGGSLEINRLHSLIGDSAVALDQESEGSAGNPTTGYVETSINDGDFYPGGNADVKFEFSNGETLSLSATVSAEQLPAGEVNRNSSGELTTETDTGDHSDHH